MHRDHRVRAQLTVTYPVRVHFLVETCHYMAVLVIMYPKMGT